MLDPRINLDSEGFFIGHAEARKVFDRNITLDDVVDIMGVYYTEKVKSNIRKSIKLTSPTVYTAHIRDDVYTKVKVVVLIENPTKIELVESSNDL